MSEPVDPWDPSLYAATISAIKRERDNPRRLMGKRNSSSTSAPPRSSSSSSSGWSTPQGSSYGSSGRRGGYSGTGGNGGYVGGNGRGRGRGRGRGGGPVSSSSTSRGVSTPPASEGTNEPSRSDQSSSQTQSTSSSLPGLPGAATSPPRTTSNGPTPPSSSSWPPSSPPSPPPPTLPSWDSNPSSYPLHSPPHLQPSTATPLRDFHRSPTSASPPGPSLPSPPTSKPSSSHPPLNVPRLRPYQNVPKPPALLNKAYLQTSLPPPPFMGRFERRPPPPPPPVSNNPSRSLPSQEEEFREFQRQQYVATGEKPKVPRPDKTRLLPTHLVVGTRRGRTIYSDFEHPLPNVREPDGQTTFQSFLSVNFARSHFFFRTYLEKHRECEALFPLSGEILFDDIVSGGVQLERARQNEKDVWVLTLTSRRPPKYVVTLKEPVQLLDEAGIALDEMYTDRQGTEMDFASSERVTQEEMVMDRGALVKRRLATFKRREEIDSGPVTSFGQTTSNGLLYEAAHWLTFRFTFPSSSRQTLFDVMDKLSHLSSDDVGNTIVARMSDDLAQDDQPLPSPNLGGLHSQPFAIRYLIDSLVAHGRIRTWDVSKLIDAVSRHAKHPWEEPRILEDLFLEERTYNISAQVAKLADTPRPRPIYPTKHMASPRRALLTPLRLLSFPPEPETSNRVLQKWHEKIDQFLRVHFCDEDDALWIDWLYRIYDDSHPSSGVLGRVRRALRNGVKIGGKHYVFLAFGESQSKERSCWFFSEDPPGTPNRVTAAGIRTWMGDFSKEKIVAKYAARMGLCFSSTRFAMKVEMKRIKDIKTLDKKHLFTDGVGIASPSILKQAAKTLGKTYGVDSTPSAVQFRAGGVKGVLVAWENHPSWVDENMILIRPSMLKFASTEKDLQVMKVSTFSFAYLNRQFITILSYLGIDDSVFSSLFQSAVRAAKKIGSPGYVAWVLQELPQDEEELDPRIYATSTFPIAELIESGFGAEPILQNILNVLEVRSLQDLKYRARIEIKQGAFLLGVVDELGVLEEGEIFVRYEDSRRLDLGRHTVVGSVVVARAPALHPGDMRVVKAVDRPELHHLVNVVVFNKKGKRDLASQLAGGDLDGDMFTVIWDKRLVPKKRAQAFDYDPPNPKTVDKEITPLDLQGYLVEYMKEDNLGQIGNSWLALSDRYGPSHPYCLQLCQLHSFAVDYPKTGVSASLPAYLRPSEWPDFMNKTHLQAAKIYESDKPLGILFRSLPEPVYDPIAEEDFIDPRLQHFEVDQSYIFEAAKMSRAYNTLLAGLMRRWALSEVEVVSGIVLKTNRKRAAKDDSIKEAARDAYVEIVRPILKSIDLWLEAHPPLANLDLDRMTLFAIAAYQITSDRHLFSAYAQLDREERERTEAEENKDSVKEEDEEEIELEPETDWKPTSTKFVSFPWIFASQLVRFTKVLREKEIEKEQESWEVGSAVTDSTIIE